MPFKDPNKAMEYHREYYRKYMQTIGLKYRIKAEKTRQEKKKRWKKEGVVDYIVYRLRAKYGEVGVEVFFRDNCSCRNCNESDYRKLDIHHIIPKSKGGKDTLENLITLCVNCHRVEHFGDYKTGNISQSLWDIHWLRFANEISKHSHCLSRKIGAVITKNNVLLSIGWNGPARGVKHCNERHSIFYHNLDVEKKYAYHNDFTIDKCPRRIFGYQSGQGLHLCQAGHAERNALIQCARNGISTLGTTLYCWCGQVCKDCAIEIINAGVKRLVYLKGDAYDGYSDTILKESGIEIVIYDEKEII